MAFERFYITNDGAQYLALAQAGSKLVITKAQIGTGYLGTGQSAVSRTALITPLKDCAIQSKQAVGSTVNVTMQFVNTDGAGNVLDPFWWAEVGLFAKLDNDPDHPEILFGYANAMDQAHADYIPGTLMEFLFVMALNAQNAADNVLVDITAPVLYLATDGDGSEVTSDVTEETSAAVNDLAPGTALKSLIGKMKKLITDILANKVSKVTGATPGNFAGLDTSGELTDSGKKAADFANAVHSHQMSGLTGDIGGQNLLYNSGFYAGSDGWAVGAYVTRDISKKLFGTNSMHSQQSGLGSDGWRGITVAAERGMPCGQGEIYTLSAYVFVADYTLFEGRRLELGANIYNSAGAMIGAYAVYFIPTASNNGKWTRVTATFTVNEAAAASARAYCITQRNGESWVACLKLERGNIGTGWSPSWADMLAGNFLYRIANLWADIGVPGKTSIIGTVTAKFYGRYVDLRISVRICSNVADNTYVLFSLKNGYVNVLSALGINSISWDPAQSYCHMTTPTENFPANAPNDNFLGYKMYAWADGNGDCLVGRFYGTSGNTGGWALNDIRFLAGNHLDIEVIGALYT